MPYGMPRFILAAFCLLLFNSGRANSQQIWNPPQGGKITTSINGDIKDSVPGVDQYRAIASVSRQNSSGAVLASASSYFEFADPSQRKASYWGSGINQLTFGSRSHANRRGIISETISNPFIYGTSPLLATTGGSLKVELGPQMTGTTPGEVRFRTLDTCQMRSDFLPSSVSDYLESGRVVYSGYLKWEPPINHFGFVPYDTYTADLEVELKFGHDGIIDGGPDVKWAMARAVDLDVVTDPVNKFVDFSNITGSGSFGYTYRDGDQSIRIRRQGGSPPKPLESGWTVNPAWPTSYVTMQNKRTGLLTTQTINWGNRTANSTPTTNYVNTWPGKGLLFTIPNITLLPKPSTVFEIKAVTSNWSSASRNLSLGKTRFPADKSDPAPIGNLPPYLGNGVEVRVNLRNLRKI